MIRMSKEKREQLKVLWAECYDVLALVHDLDEMERELARQENERFSSDVEADGNLQRAHAAESLAERETARAERCTRDADAQEARAEKAEASCAAFREALAHLEDTVSSSECTADGCDAPLVDNIDIAEVCAQSLLILTDDAGTTLLARHAEEVAGLKAERDRIRGEVVGACTNAGSFMLAAPDDPTGPGEVRLAIKRIAAERDALRAWKDAGESAWSILTETAPTDCPGPWAVRDAADKRDDEAIAAEGERDALQAKVEGMITRHAAEVQHVQGIFARRAESAEAKVERLTAALRRLLRVADNVSDVHWADDGNESIAESKAALADVEAVKGDK